ncbi:MAG: hypothetical protein IKD90_11800 [Clostridiales bacterium]|nr:hypothetical protein [Clostridiales bacterium]
MRTLKKIAAIVLAGAMVFSIAGCKKGSKKVSADDFKKVCEEASLKVVDEAADEGVTKSLSAKNDDESIEVNFMVAKDEDEAKKGFEYFTNNTDSMKEMGADVKSSSDKIEVTMNSLLYMYAVRNGDTIVTVSAAGEEQIKTGKDIVKKLGI